MVLMLITVAPVDLSCVLGAFIGFLGVDVQWRNFYVIAMDFYWVKEHDGMSAVFGLFKLFSFFLYSRCDTTLFSFHPSNAGVLTGSLKLGSSRSPRALHHARALLSKTWRAGQSWLPAVAAVAGLHSVSALLFPLLLVRTG